MIDCVWVVAFESESSGGFEWRYKLEDAVREYEERMSDPEEWGQSVYFVEYHPSDMGRFISSTHEERVGWFTDEVDGVIWEVLPDERQGVCAVQ